jgi:hypothetical protein
MMRIKIPAMRATIGWNAGWIGISTLRVCEKSLFWESIQPYTIVPHDFAFGVGADAGECEKGLQAMGKRPVGMWVIHGHDDVVVADVVDDDP